MSADNREEAAGEELERQVEAAEAAGTQDAATPGTETSASGGGAVSAAPASAGAAVPAADNSTAGTSAEPDDANDLRGYHFRELLGKTKTWVFLGGGSVLIGAIVAAAAGPVIGAVVFVVAFLFGLWMTFNIADSRAADDFFHVYAKSRNLELGGKTSLPPSTPLLRKGDEQYAERTLSGELGPQADGMLAIYTFVTESTDSKGNREKTYHPYTLGMSQVDECMEHVPELYCQRKSGLRSLEKFEDVFRVSKERVKLESEALDRKYEIFCDKGQDPTWLRQLFSPVFIVWLTESAPEKFAFELVAGTLVAYVHGHKEDTADLDGVAKATTTVAARLREQSVDSTDAAS